MYKIWGEWDCGQESLIFTSREAAKNWFDVNPMNIEAWEDEDKDREFDSPFEFYEDAGLFSLEKMTIID